MKSKNNIEQFDDFFKESLENASVKAPSGVFENVATQIGSNAATTAAAVVAKSVVIKVVAAVVVATVAAIGVYKYNAVEEKNALSIEQETIVENAPVVENEIEGIKVFPNPTNGEVYISLENSVDELNIEVFTIKGELVLQESYFNTDRIKLNLDNKPGIYLVRLTGSEINKMIRIIKN